MPEALPQQSAAADPLREVVSVHQRSVIWSATLGAPDSGSLQAGVARLMRQSTTEQTSPIHSGQVSRSRSTPTVSSADPGQRLVPTRNEGRAEPSSCQPQLWTPDRFAVRGQHRAARSCAAQAAVADEVDIAQSRPDTEATRLRAAYPSALDPAILVRHASSRSTTHVQA
jgi:hypothetical protein